MSPKLRTAGITTAALVAGQVFHFPPLQDAIAGKSVADIATLHFPAWHIIFTPLSVLADFITFNTARQDVVLVVYLVLAYWAWKVFQWKTRKPRWTDIGDYIVYLACVLGFLTWAMLLPRPAARFEFIPKPDRNTIYTPHGEPTFPLSPPEELLAIDFHSHSSYSWDGRRVMGIFTPEKNIEWHKKMGFRAAFITDHNVFEGSIEANRISSSECFRSIASGSDRLKGTANIQPNLYRSIIGEEVSLHDTHIVVLGNHRPIDNANYNQSVGDIFRFLREEPAKFGGLAVMSLPEYWKHHPESRWEEFADAGAAGFEIVTSAPKALDFPNDLRDKVLELCRKRNLLAIGATDTHGWGSAAFVWNIMRIPGQSSMDPAALQKAVLQTLRRDGFNAVQIVQRTKQAPLPFPAIALDPILMLWMMCRTFNWVQTLVCAAWIWATACLPILLKPLGKG